MLSMKSTPTPDDSASSTGVSRRELLTGTAKLAGAAALLSAVRTAFPSGVWAAPADTPETKRAVLGFIALTDSSPLIVAKEKGYYAKYGMPDVEVLSRRRGAPRATTSSWDRPRAGSTARTSSRRCPI
jgi:nitrate/nitrite transport system substrate-binding protein